MTKNRVLVAAVALVVAAGITSPAAAQEPVDVPLDIQQFEKPLDEIERHFARLTSALDKTFP